MNDLFGDVSGTKPPDTSPPPPAILERPDPFDGILGHVGPLRILSTALASGRVPHAYLFTGPEGVGKTTVAESLAAALLCTNKDHRPCGHCAACGRTAHGNPFNLQRIVPDGAQIKIEQIRTMTDLMMTGPDRGVVILGPAEAMRDQAANALLKTLEEPPSGWTLILTASSAEALLPTIRSRCQHISFGRLPERDSATVLRRAGVESRYLDDMTRLAQGSPGALLRTGMDADELMDDFRAAVGLFSPNTLESPMGILAAAETWGRDPDTTRRFLTWAQVWVSEALHHACNEGGRGGDESAIGLSQNSLAETALGLDTALTLLNRNVSRQSLIEEILIMMSPTGSRASCA